MQNYFYKELIFFDRTGLKKDKTFLHKTSMFKTHCMSSHVRRTHMVCVFSSIKPAQTVISFKTRKI